MRYHTHSRALDLPNSKPCTLTLRYVVLEAPDFRETPIPFKLLPLTCEGFRVHDGVHLQVRNDRLASLVSLLHLAFSSTRTSPEAHWRAPDLRKVIELFLQLIPTCVCRAEYGFTVSKTMAGGPGDSRASSSLELPNNDAAISGRPLSMSLPREICLVTVMCCTQLLALAPVGAVIAPLHVIAKQLNADTNAQTSWFLASERSFWSQVGWVTSTGTRDCFSWAGPGLVCGLSLRVSARFPSRLFSLIYVGRYRVSGRLFCYPMLLLLLGELTSRRSGRT